MRLTTKQKASVEKYNWDVISNDDGNCAWIAGQLIEELQ